MTFCGIRVPLNLKLGVDYHNKHVTINTAYVGSMYIVSYPTLKIQQTNMPLRLFLDPMSNEEKENRLILPYVPFFF